MEAAPPFPAPAEDEPEPDGTSAPRDHDEAATLAEVTGWDPDEIAGLEAPFRLGDGPPDTDRD